jgi:alpha-tubulin suppressor-like RCC1 family protein
VQTCSEISGCPAWGPEAACPAGKPCAGASPNADCTCPIGPSECNGQASGTFCSTPSTVATCGLDENQCLVAQSTMSCAHGCSGSHPNAVCCTPNCAGKCAGSDGCGGTCPNNCVAPESCGGGEVDDACGCTPMCAGKCSGSDGCGGTCTGVCPIGETCGAEIPDFCGVTPPKCSVRIGAGANHTCARRSDHKIYCWGQNDSGQVGDNSTVTPKAMPSPIGAGLLSSSELFGGGAHTCAMPPLLLYCWGSNTQGQIGNGTWDTPKMSPVMINFLASALSLGTSHTCAVDTTTSNVLCWGLNADGQLGLGMLTTPRNTPQPVAVERTTFDEVAAGGHHTCALTTGGTVLCWGKNDTGQVGDDSTVTPRLLPSPVVGLPAQPAVKQIWSRAGHTCARLADGSLRCWGANAEGQIGNETTASAQPTAVPVTALTGAVSQVAVGGAHTCALKTDGTVWCWGRNTHGQLGNGMIKATPQLTAVPVSTLGSTVIEVTAGLNHTCARKSDNSMWCWGQNESGQIGDGSTTSPRPWPRAVRIPCP